MAEKVLHVQVCHAAVESVFMQDIQLVEGVTLDAAIRSSGLLQAHPEIDVGNAKVGIFGKLRPLDTVLRDGDRIEVYRPLRADPKDARRRRAKKALAASGAAAGPALKEGSKEVLDSREKG